MKIQNYKANAGFGVIFPAKTFIYEGELDVYLVSPGPLDEQCKKEIVSLNKNIHIIAPNNFHHMHIKKAKESFPLANFYGPKRAQTMSEVELINTSELPDRDLKSINILGHKTLGETCFYIDKIKTLIITDLIFNMHHKMNLASKLTFMLVGCFHKLGMSKLIKRTIDDNDVFRESLQGLLKFPFEQVLINHGDSLSRDEFVQFIEEELK